MDLGWEAKDLVRQGSQDVSSHNRFPAQYGHHDPAFKLYGAISKMCAQTSQQNRRFGTLPRATVRGSHPEAQEALGWDATDLPQHGRQVGTWQILD